MDAIAERAGVSKATIYRWWPTKETLAIDALYEDWAAAYSATPDSGRLRDDLCGVLLPWADHIVKRPYARVLGALITRARTDDAFAKEFDQRLVQPRRHRARLTSIARSSSVTCQRKPTSSLRSTSSTGPSTTASYRLISQSPARSPKL